MLARVKKTRRSRHESRQACLSLDEAVIRGTGTATMVVGLSRRPWVILGAKAREGCEGKFKSCVVSDSRKGRREEKDGVGEAIR